VLSLRAESSTSPEAEGDFTVLSSGVSLAEDMSRKREWDDEGRMESEVALVGFGGGGMARLDGLARPPVASASAEGNCGDRAEETSIEGGADEGGGGPEESSIVVFKFSSLEHVMARGQTKIASRVKVR
jgi:hypothetical protein